MTYFSTKNPVDGMKEKQLCFYMHAHQGQNFFFQFSFPMASRLEMHLPNKFLPDPKLSFIFKSAIFHLATYKYTRSHFHSYYINKISNYQQCVASKLQ